MADDPLSIPSYSDVLAAARRLDGVAVTTPLVENPALSERVGGRILLKLELLQRTGSFKFRGAYNRLSQLSAAERARGVVAFSSGNHAQGVAAAAKMLGMPAVIVMPSDAPRVKLANTRALGAEVVFYDRVKDSREKIAAAIAAERGSVVVPAFDDFHVVAGQGTAGVEIVQQTRAMGLALDAVLVPCSGGGLTSGIALALSEAVPGTQTVAVEPEDFDGAKRSLAARQRVAAPGGRMSVADSLMAPMPGAIPFALLSALRASGVTVADAALTAAVAYAARELKLVVEPGGAAALAAVLSGRYEARGKAVALVLSGGNIDPEMLVRCLDFAP